MSSSAPAQNSNPESKTPAGQDDDFHAAFPHLTPDPPPSTSTSTTSMPEAFLADQYPTNMSCTAAFDAAFYCASLGGHFNDIYRYGELRSCSEHWRDWRFCMGLSIYSKETQREKIRQHYIEKEEALKGKPNSEDIWERRTERDRIVDAFSKAEEEARRVEKA